MLIIRRKNTDPELEKRPLLQHRIEKKDIKQAIKDHLTYYGRESHRREGSSDPFDVVQVSIPPADWIFEWVEGDPGNPTSVEIIPLPFPPK